IAGSSVPGYNGTFTIADVPTTTTFTYTARAGLGIGSGGTATAGMVFNVYLNGISGADVTFDWLLRDGAGAAGAKAGLDYGGDLNGLTAGTAKIPKGSLYTSIPIPV